MILGFKTQWNGQPTHFVQKILACKIDEYKKDFAPKIHTIRKGNRWKSGNSIQMATGVRTKKYFQFNGGNIGLDVCKKVQSIEIFRVDYLPRNLHDKYVYVEEIHIPSMGETFTATYKVQIDGRFLSVDEIKQFAMNDGFLSPEQMFLWFDNNDFQGQLIHWTDAFY